MGAIGELTIDEQRSLQTLLTRLLRADAGAAARAMSSVTLLWLDWMELWEGRAAAPIRCETDRSVQEAHRRAHRFEAVTSLDADELGPEVIAAIEALRCSPARFCIYEFLVEVAKINGVTAEEERFLSFVEGSLDRQDQSGPYR